MSDEVDEMSAASRGSRMINPNKVILDGEQSDAIIAAQAAEIRRLKLTDDERLLIAAAADEWKEHADRWRDNDETVASESDKNAAILRGLLERM